MPHCSHCGKEHSPDAAACPGCGQPFQKGKKTDIEKIITIFLSICTVILIPAVAGLYNVYASEKKAIDERITEEKRRGEAAQMALKQQIDQEASKLQEQLDKQFARANSQVENAQYILKALDTEDLAEKKRSILFALAFYEQATLPPAILPMLALCDEGNDSDLTTIFVESLTLLATATDQPERTRRYAVIALNKLRSTPQTTVAALATSAALSKLDQGVVPEAASKNQDAQTKAQQDFSALPQESDTIEKAIAGLPPSLQKEVRPRVYLHIADETQRSPAEKAKQILAGKDYLVPGIQNLANRPRAYIPDTLEVRFFDWDARAKASEILALLKQNGAQDGRVSYVKPSPEDLKASTDISSHFEVWAGRKTYPAL